jgi:hypothetical protein
MSEKRRPARLRPAPHVSNTVPSLDSLTCSLADWANSHLPGASECAGPHEGSGCAASVRAAWGELGDSMRAYGPSDEMS